MDSLFDGKTSFNSNISNWNTSKVTSMYQMFKLANAFNQNIGNWNTSKVTTMERMFWCLCFPTKYFWLEYIDSQKYE